MISDREGWYAVRPHVLWRCPTCSMVSPVESWAESESWCDDCGSHDARRCPGCGGEFDAVFDSKRIELATVAWEREIASRLKEVTL